MVIVILAMVVSCVCGLVSLILFGALLSWQRKLHYEWASLKAAREQLEQERRAIRAVRSAVGAARGNWN